MTGTPLEMWWPSPEALEDLTVTDIDTGWQLSAPDDTELAEWLDYWSQDEEHQEFFNTEFISVITAHALKTLEQNGENEILPDGSQGDRKQTEDECSGTLSQHEPGSDT